MKLTSSDVTEFIAEAVVKHQITCNECTNINDAIISGECAVLNYGNELILQIKDGTEFKVKVTKLRSRKQES